MAGSDANLDAWISALVSDEHRNPVLLVEDGVTQRSNRAAARFFGAPLRPGTNVGELFDPASRSKLGEALALDRPTATELQIGTEDGSVRAARFLVLPRTPGRHLLIGTHEGMSYSDDQGQLLLSTNDRLTNLIRELSKRAARADSDRKSLQEIGALRELFIAALAHDFKSPLNTILFSVTLLSQSEAVGPEQLRRHTGMVERSVRRMLRLIESLLLTVRLDATEELSGEEPVSLGTLARETAGDYQLMAEQAGATITTRVDDRALVEGDPLWLGQLFSNLLTNAIRHAPSDTAIEIVVELIEAGWARCSVSDRGPGIPDALKERVYERFVQGPRQTGTIGLGLYICRRVVELHGGTIHVEDNPGGGARIVFELPTAEPASRRAGPGVSSE